MGTIPLGQGDYHRYDLPPVWLENQYYETAPTNLEDGVALIPRARLAPFTVAGNGPIMGLYREGGVLANAGQSGRIYALSASDLYQVIQPGQPGAGTARKLGTIDGGFRMTSAGNPAVVLFTAGQTPWQYDGTSLTALTFPDSNIVSAIDTLDNRFLFASAFGRFYWSDVGTTNVDALSYATAESHPDELLTLKVAGDELWLFGRLSIEVWQPTGDLNLPYQRINGRVFGIGITVRDTCQRINFRGIDTICWMGTDKRIYRTDPNPRKISDEALDQVLKDLTLATTPSATAPYATTDSWNGHDFYVLTVPGVGTWAHDLLTEKWHQRTTYDRAQYRASASATAPNNQPLIGDDHSGSLFFMADDRIDDAGDPVVFEFTGLLEVTSAAQRLNNVTLDLGAGLSNDPNDDPMITLETSKDMGKTFSAPVTVSLGRQGERRTLVAWTRLGMLQRPGRIFRWRTTQPVTVRKAKYNEPLR